VTKDGCDGNLEAFGFQALKLSTPYVDEVSRFSTFTQKFPEASVAVQNVIPAVIAYSCNVANSGVCTESTCHYSVFANTVLVTCSTLVMAALTLPNDWKNPISTLLRVATTMGVFFFALGLMGRQRIAYPFIPENIPKHDADESILILPATYFLDPSFDVEANRGLTTAWSILPLARHCRIIACLI
jgi:hypothetical protein